MESRKALVAANWKMHKTVNEAVAFVEQLQQQVGAFEDREVLIAPPFTALSAIRKVMTKKGFLLGAQNCHFEEKGAFTGEVSVGMLKDVGCDYIIVGHSERRQLFGETDEIVGRKVQAVFGRQLLPILCLGETLDQREAGKTLAVVSTQLDQAAKGLTSQQAARLVIAYEPVWAIGTGKTASPEQAQEVHGMLRERYAALYDKTIANQIRIVYGGSVKPDNVDQLMAQPDIDGSLVGGASLDVASFKRIVQYQ